MGKEDTKKDKSPEEKEKKDDHDDKDEDSEKGDGKEDLKLYVGNITDLGDKDVKDLFSKLSKQTTFTRIKDAFGFLQAYDKKDYEEALKLHGTKIHGTEVSIAKANKKGEQNDDKRDSVRDKPSVFVKNLSYGSTKDSIQDFFSKCGEVVDVYLPKSRDRDGHRGFCYVRFADEDGQKGALGLNNEELDGRQLYIDHPRDSKSGSENRRGGSGGYRRDRNDRNGRDGDRRGGYDRRDTRKRSFYDRDDRDDRRDDRRGGRDDRDDRRGRRDDRDDRRGGRDDRRRDDRRDY